jgi:hypothetical protein|nr:hypothetical protein [Chlorobaculum thiosulfatiphilum]
MKSTRTAQMNRKKLSMAKALTASGVGVAAWIGGLKVAAASRSQRQSLRILTEMIS